METNNYCVYAHINKINGKTYVGITSNVKRRWYPVGYKKCTRFNAAIEKYGWDNFKHIVLIDNVSQEVACIIEMELIKKFKLQDKNFGYNVSSGGIKKKKPRQGKIIYQYSLDGEYLREWENAKFVAQVLGLNYTGLCSTARGEKYYRTNGGYQWSFEKYDKMDPYAPIDQHKKHPPICRFDGEGNLIATYNDIWDTDFTDSQVHDIVHCCNGSDYKSRLDSVWLWESEATKENIEKAVSIYKNRWYGFQDVKKVCQYDFDGKLLNIFESCTEASNVTGINYSSLQGACGMASRLHQSCGYLWYYFNETDGKDVSPYKSKSARIPVLHFSLDGKFINKYNSIKQAIQDGHNEARRALETKIYVRETGIWIPANQYDELKEEYDLEDL